MAKTNGIFFSAAIAGLGVATLGCGFVPKQQFSACEAQARILSEENKAQLAEIANLKAHNRKLEDQLLDADKELSGLSKRVEADQKRLANFQVERERVQEHVDGLVRGAKITGITPVRDEDVERLTKRFPMLRFDPTSGAYKLDVDVLFDGDGTQIAPQSEKLLGEFAAIFAEPEARDLRVLVVGRAVAGGAETTAAATGGKSAKPPTAANGKAKPSGDSLAAERRLGTERALAVAEFLRKVGLADERVGVSGVADERAGGAKEAAPKQATRRVEIFVTGKRTPIVGWDTGLDGRF